MSHFLSPRTSSNTFLPSPILTFIVILILPSCLTFVTLLIHRVRMARAAQRDRAPEHLVKSLPWRVWNGTSWEKHNGSVPHPDLASLPASLDIEAADQSTSRPSGSHDPIPWCETQLECAICLFEFVKGDRVRELPCHHVFHLDEVDPWLINRKKFVRLLGSPCSLAHHLLHPSVRSARQMSPNLGNSPWPKRPPIPSRVPTQTGHQLPPPLHHPQNAPHFFMTDTRTHLYRTHDSLCLYYCTIALLLYSTERKPVSTLGHVLPYSCLFTRPFITFGFHHHRVITGTSSPRTNNKYLTRFATISKVRMEI